MIALKPEHFVTEHAPRDGNFTRRPFFEWLELAEHFLGEDAIRRASDIVSEQLGSQAGAVLFDATQEFNANVFNQLIEKVSNEQRYS